MKEFIVTKSSTMEIQNLVVNPKSEPVKPNSKPYQFLFKYVSSKNQWQNFKTAVVLSIKCRRYRAE